MSKGLDLDQDQFSVGPDLGPNCLKRLSADNIAASKEKVNTLNFFFCVSVNIWIIILGLTGLFLLI